jgi:uncharacterized repeat protein (TIGR01451 family)/fimbrial isopeptide formation D2 family protein
MHSFLSKLSFRSLFIAVLLFSNLAFAEYTFEKTAYPASPNGQTEVEIGDPIQYTITIDDIYRNEAAEVFTIQDQINEDFDFDINAVTLWSENLDENNQTVRRNRTQDILQSTSFCTLNADSFECTIPECGAANPIPCIFEPTKLEFIFTGTVNNNALDNIPNANGDIEVCNTALIAEPNTNINKESTVCHILADQTLDIEMVKGAELYPAKTEVERGEVFRYQLTIFNRTDQALTDVVIQDTIDENLELQSVPEFCSDWDPNTRLLTCTIETITPQSQFPTFELEVQVKQVTTADEITNQAFLLYNGATYPSEIVRHTIADGISISKDASPMHNSLVRPNEPITYEITVHNPTDTDVTNQIVKDQLPENLVVDTQNLPTECLYDEDTRMLICTVDVPAQQALSINILTVVQNNTLDRICNEAELVLDDNNSLLSFPVCHNIGENLWSIAKSASPEDGSTVAWLEFIDYTITIQNIDEGIEETIVVTDVLDDKVTLLEAELPTECTYKPDIHTVTCTFVPGDSGLKQTEINIPLAVQVNENTEGTIENSAIMTFINRPLIPFMESNTVVHEIEPPALPSIEIIKSSETDTETVLKSGDIQYTIEIKNTGSTVATDITVTDELPTVLQQPTQQPSNCTWGGGIITCDIVSLAPGETETIDLVAALKMPDEITTGAYCNIAEVSYDINGQDMPIETSNPVCHNVEGETSGGGGGGSARIHPSIGKCSVVPDGYNGSRWGCTPVYPTNSINHEDPYYDTYIDCVDDADGIKKDETDCLIEWALAHGYGICGPTDTSKTSEYSWAEYWAEDPVIMVPYAGSANYDNDWALWNQQCSTEIIETPGDGSGVSCTDSGLQISVNNIQKTITSGDIIARGDRVDYQIRVTPRIQNAPTSIESAKITIYDYTVPSDSGKIWHRNGIIDSNGNLRTQYGDWTLSGSVASGIQFTQTFDNLDDLAQTHVLEYSMDSELAIDKDVAQLKNAAFVRLLVNYTETITNADGTTSSVPETEDIYFDQEGNNICAQSIDPASLGATATVNVIRPFLDAQGGGNVGGLQQQDGEHKLFGDVQTIEDSLDTNINTQPINSIEEETPVLLPETTAPVVDTNKLNEYQQNASETETYFGKPFTTTPDRSGIYFGNNAITLSGTFDAEGQSKTFVIEGGKINITNDFKVTNGYVAFIVRGGNILITDNVTNIEGVFIVEDGEIRGGTENYTNPLTISGGLIGDAKDLIGKRRYIGTEDNLQPSMTIIFDLRLLDQTPPGLEDFLGGNWEQAIE